MALPYSADAVIAWFQNQRDLLTRIDRRWTISPKRWLSTIIRALGVPARNVPHMQTIRLPEATAALRRSPVAGAEIIKAGRVAASPGSLHAGSGEQGTFLDTMGKNAGF